MLPSDSGAHVRKLLDAQRACVRAAFTALDARGSRARRAGHVCRRGQSVPGRAEPDRRPGRRTALRGRASRPDRRGQVLTAVAEALSLSGTETEHLRNLARPPRGMRPSSTWPACPSPARQLLRRSSVTRHTQRTVPDPVGHRRCRGKRLGVARIVHPAVGTLSFDYQALAVPARPDRTLLTYLPRPESAEALGILLSWTADRSTAADRAGSGPTG
ncbi:MmyB family transcriptional regulator [Streptomyces parvus]|uniref:MmyB family transcriptional regulator n=1 Tax=Streptomyces parvus TaxID=66428 RepID=UPI0035E25575